jgi:hypothetical protein
MKKILLLIIVLGISYTSFAQITFDIKGKTLDYFRKYEQAAKSTPIKNNSQFISFDGTGQPVIFRRKEKQLPDVLVSYFPKKDSTISYISYEWDGAGFMKDHRIAKQPVDSLKIYIEKYKALLSLVKAEFGEGKSTGSLDNLLLIETGDFQQIDTFNKNDISVEMYIDLSNLQASNGLITILPTRRIRLYVKNQ